MSNWELVNFCEFDKYAIKSYCAIHNVDESLNLGDISKVDEKDLKDFDMMTWGFPCTDISISGKQMGFIDEDGNKTRSGMYYEGIRILREKKPAISIIENVKNLTGKRFKNEFETVLRDLEEAGYNSYWQVLDAKDYGIPQHRERVFIISIRKDLDNGNFKFPEPISSDIRLVDVLEDNVDDKFYISNTKIEKFISSVPNIDCLLNLFEDKGSEIITGITKNKGECFVRDTEYANTLLARDYKGFGNQEMNCVLERKLHQVAQIYPNSGNPQAGRVYDANGISPSLDTCQGGNRMPKILDIHCSSDNEYEVKVRRLTPKECFRVMGFPDEAFEKAASVGISATQLYKQSGNSIVVNVLYYIFKELYEVMPYLFEDLKVGSFFSGIGAFELALDLLYKDINQ